MRHSSVCLFSRVSDVLYLQTLKRENMLIFKYITALQSPHVKFDLHISELVHVSHTARIVFYGFSNPDKEATTKTT